MNFLHGSKLTVAMKHLVQSSQQLKIAIAYWGDNAVTLLGLDPGKQDLEVVCCLKGGKSSPGLVEGFGKRARQNDKLHAKVIWSPALAMVGSANASSNGLPEEEESANGLIEAGLVVKDPGTLAEIDSWFKKLYRNSRPITKGDLRAAEIARKNRIYRSGRSELPTRSMRPLGIAPRSQLRDKSRLA